MSMSKTSQTPASTSASARPPERSQPTPEPRVDTSNLSPGAAKRFETLLRSIDDFTEAVHSKAIILPDRK